jgi:FkbM family methyltransferase
VRSVRDSILAKGIAHAKWRIRRFKTAIQQPISTPKPSVELPPGALDCTIGFNEFGAYCLPRSSQRRPAAQTILRSRIWEPEAIELLRNIDGNIVHAGTYFGDFLPAIARNRDGTVWAFEPNEESFRCAQVTMMLNNLKNVRLDNCALGSQRGSAVIQTTDRQGQALGGLSRISDPDSAFGQSVPLTSIDESTEGPISVIQLDIEGHEQEALAGALKTIERDRPVLILESLPSSVWMEEHLERYGYRVEQRLDQGASVVLKPGSP